MPIGMEMYNADRYGQYQPTLVSIADSDTADLKKLKTLIMKMATYEPKVRHSAVRVAQILGEITGFNLYFYRNVESALL